MKELNSKSLNIFLCLVVFLLILPKSTNAMTFSAANNITSSGIQNSRIAGEDRYDTSAAIAKNGWDSSYYAIIACGETFPDALCAAPLAAKYGAPILLTSTNRLEDSTKEQLLSLNVKSVIMIGGEGVLSAGVEQEIKDLGISVWRIAGQDRYETSLDVAQVLGKSKEAVIATGDDFQDVLSVAPIAAQKGMPIILTPSNELSTDIKDYIDKTVEKSYVLGDESYISDNVFNQLPSPQRISGNDHYSMNIQIIKTFASDLNLNTCYIATGESYPDALSGSALASLTKSPVILTKEPLSKDTMNFYTQNMNNIKRVIALGGTAVVSDNLLSTFTTNRNPNSNPGTSNTGADNNYVLGTPNHVEVNALDKDEIDLSWDSINNAISYNVYRTTADSGIYELIANVNFPYYADDSVLSGVTYFYKVQAANTTVTGPYSSIVSAAPLLDESVFSSPKNLMAVARDDSQILLNWNGVDNATYYNIYRATTYAGTYEKISSAVSPNFIDSSVSIGKMYYYKVQAVCDKGQSTFSNIAYSIIK